MSLYADILWPKVRDAFLAEVHSQGHAHGSILRDLILEHYPGAHLERADTLLYELVETDRLELVRPKANPTHSQAAFAGLGMTRQGYAATGWAAGTREHFYYQLPRKEVE